MVACILAGAAFYSSESVSEYFYGDTKFYWHQAVLGAYITGTIFLCGWIAERGLRIDEMETLPTQEFAHAPKLTGGGSGEDENLGPVRDSAASQEENRPTVFLSYANEDQEDVDDIRKFLKACGINTWQDRENLRGGAGGKTV